MPCPSSANTPQCSEASKVRKSPKRVARTDYLEDAQKRPRIEARFWSKVKKAPDDQCWEWTGAVLRPPNLPYGRFTIDGVMRAHRASWLLSGRTIPDGLFVCHKCDNPRCVRVDHLFLGTARDNTQDSILKGRMTRTHGRQPNTKFGTAAHSARLTEKDVLQIRSEGNPSIGRRRELARHYGVTRTAIRDVLRRHTWTHI
jgi:hypothetical protein